MTEPTKEAVAECYTLARNFLKGGAKASDKKYDAAVSTNKAREADLRIYGGDFLAGDEMGRFPAHTVGYGRVMREMGNTFANASESTGLAASYAAERMPDVALTALRAPPPYDHAFLLVGGQPSAGMSFSDLRSIPTTEKVFVVDVWAGICCQASEFDALLETKMRRWDHDGKRVVRNFSRENQQMQGDDLYASVWGAGLRGSRLSAEDARSFGSEEQLQSLRDFMASERIRAMQNLRREEHESRLRRADIVEKWSQLERHPELYRGPGTAELKEAWKREKGLLNIKARRLQHLGLQPVRSELPLIVRKDSPVALDVAHDMTEPTAERVLQCYNLARDFFKRAAKADNKCYDPTVNRAKARAADDRVASAQVLAADQARYLFPMHSIGYGQIMRETGNTFGNCGEATGVAASYVAQLMPKVEIAVADTSPFDHAFLVVGSKPSTMKTVAGFNDVSSQDPVFVIDVWAGVCCHASEFQARLMEQMRKWDAIGKQVFTVGSDGHGGLKNKVVKSSMWAQSLHGSEITWHDPHGFGSAQDLQELRDYMKEDHDRVMESLKKEDRGIRARRRKIADTLGAIETDRGGFLRESKVSIENQLAAVSSGDERRWLEDKLRTLQTNENLFLDEFKEGRRLARQTLDGKQVQLNRKLQQIGMQAVRSEGPMAPIARQRVARPADTEVKPQLGGNLGRSSSRRR